MIYINNLIVTAFNFGGNTDISDVAIGENVLIGEPFPEPRQSIPGDIVLWDNNNEQKLVIPSDELNNYSTEDYTPIGIIVIPPSHDVYGTGEGAMVSIVSMSGNTPDTGNVSESVIRFGTTNYVLNKIKIDTKSCNCIDDIYSENPKIINTNGGCLPTDTPNTTTCGHDINAGYGYLTYPCPSPFLSDGSRNKLYYENNSNYNGLDLSGNFLSFFDGKNKTEIILENATYQQDWKTSYNIESNNNKGCYPSACATWRYHTIGTNQGDWYLPDIGELGYLSARCNTINHSLELINNYFNVGNLLSFSYPYMSCIEQSYSNIFGISLKFGQIDRVGKGEAVPRAFCRI